MISSRPTIQVDRLDLVEGADLLALAGGTDVVVHECLCHAAIVTLLLSPSGVVQWRRSLGTRTHTPAILTITSDEKDGHGETVEPRRGC